MADIFDGYQLAAAWDEMFEPTNDSAVGQQHVVVASGRDYADVPPIKSIYHGTPSRTMEVTVNLTRLA